MKGTLRPRNYLKFRLVKVIVKEIVLKSLLEPKIGHFQSDFEADLHNVSCEKIFKDFLGT